MGQESAKGCSWHCDGGVVVPKDQEGMFWKWVDRHDGPSHPGPIGLEAALPAKGIGDIIEITRNKYGCLNGQRRKVIAQSRSSWKFEGGQNVPKHHLGDGWVWADHCS